MLLVFRDYTWTISKHVFPKTDHIDVFDMLYYSTMLYVYGNFILSFVYFLFNKFANATIHAANRIVETLIS